MWEKRVLILNGIYVDGLSFGSQAPLITRTKGSLRLLFFITPDSPDLNLFDHLWDVLEKQVSIHRA